MRELYTDEYFMGEALKEASRAYDLEEVPVGAVIVAGNRIVARSHNLTELLKDVTAHAEMQAITAASNALGGKYLNECTLYVTLEPCAMCAAALFWAQLGRLVYGADDTKRGYHLFGHDLLHPRTKVDKGLMSQDSEELLRNFFRKRR
ncbi:MAG TPA: nucleoside deaminase [Bacteroidia bacterium]|nr:nucleoside deaminase [Bacteroidia bacterium]